MSGMAAAGASPCRRVLAAPRVTRAFQLLLLLVALGGCAVSTATLDHVIVGDQRAAPSAYATVQLYRGGALQATQVPMQLQPADELATGPDSTAVIGFPSGAAVIVYPNTRVRVSSLKLIFGEVSAVLEDIRGLFEVETDDFVAAAGSTQYLVRKTAGGAGDVAVIEGRVQLSSPIGAWTTVTLSPRDRASLTPGRPPEVAVMDQDTYNRLVARDNAVRRAVGGGGARVLVPDFVGFAEASARRLLEEQGLTLARTEPRVTGRAAVGTVVDQSPPAGSRTGLGSGVTLVIEAESRQVPDLLNQPFRFAEQALREAGLILGRVDRRITGNAEPETVIGQEPAPRANVPSGSRVDLVVEAEPVTVPWLLQLPRAEAERRLREVGLRAGAVRAQITGEHPVDTVIGQAIPGDERVIRETAVDLVVEAESVLVPDLRGGAVADARRRLDQSRLRLGRVDQRLTGEARPDTVLGQDPAPGARAVPGSTVDLVVEAESVTVPTLRGMVLDQAIGTLERSGLHVRNVRRDLTESARDGQVLDQSPRPGDVVAPGSGVDLVVAVVGLRVPDLVGTPVGIARERLSGSTLRLGRVSEVETDRARPGTILDQSPPANRLVASGAVIDVQVARAPEAPCIVPDIPPYQFDWGGARSAITAARLKAQPASTAGLDDHDRVVAIKPAGGTRVPCGSVVTVTVQTIE